MEEDDVTMERTDGELLDAYRAGDVAALEEMVQRYRRPLFGYILNMIGQTEEADEVFQEVWFRAIRNLGRYREQNFPGWLMRIAHNLVIDRGRRKKPDLSLDAETADDHPLIEQIADKGRDPAANLAASDVGRWIGEAVALLPEEQKAVFLMRVEAGLSFKEIAKVQKVSINTALARMQYALAKLRPMLTDHYAALGRA